MENIVAELTFLLKDLYISLACTPLLFCDSISALHKTINPVFQDHNKHIELDCHFICKRVALVNLVTHHIPTNDQVADQFLSLCPILDLVWVRVLTITSCLWTTIMIIMNERKLRDSARKIPIIVPPIMKTLEGLKCI